MNPSLLPKAPNYLTMRTTIISAALATILLTGCNEAKPNPGLKALEERRIAEMEAQREEMMRLAETTAPDAELDEALEAAATEIEAAFASAQTLVNESKTNGGSGNCTKKEQVSGVSGSATGGEPKHLRRPFRYKIPMEPNGMPSSKKLMA